MDLDVLKFKLKTIADFIIDETYPNVGERKRNKYKNFSLILTEKEYKSRLGLYDPKAKSVQVSSVNKVYFYDLLLTLLHEIAHHIEYCEEKTSGHSPRFYRIHLDLLFKAIDCGVISYDDAMKTSSTSLARNRNKFTNMMSQYVKKNAADISTVCDMRFVKDYNKLSPINEVIKVKCSYQNGIFFKKRGYSWSKEEKVWYKSFYKQPEYNAEINFLLENKYLCFRVDGYAYYADEINLVVYGNTYNSKEKFKSLGYRFDNKEWVKTIKSCDYRKEISKLPTAKGMFYKYRYKE